MFETIWRTSSDNHQPRITPRTPLLAVQSAVSEFISIVKGHYQIFSDQSILAKLKFSDQINHTALGELYEVTPQEPLIRLARSHHLAKHVVPRGRSMASVSLAFLSALRCNGNNMEEER